MGVDLYDIAKRNVTKHGNFNRILEFSPELKKNFDKDRLQNSFNALHRYAPEMTADPMIGGSLLKAVAESPGFESTIIRDMINARKSLIDSRTGQFRMGPMPRLEMPTELQAEQLVQARGKGELERKKFLYAKGRDDVLDTKSRTERKDRLKEYALRQSELVAKKTDQGMRERQQGEKERAQLAREEAQAAARKIEGHDRLTQNRIRAASERVKIDRDIAKQLFQERVKDIRRRYPPVADVLPPMPPSELRAAWQQSVADLRRKIP